MIPILVMAKQSRVFPALPGDTGLNPATLDELNAINKKSSPEEKTEHWKTIVASEAKFHLNGCRT